MISVWQRIQRVMGARAHASVDRMEAPDEMLDQLQRELVAAVTQARTAVSGAKAWERRIADRTARAGQERDKARAAAESALRCDDEAMARAAMERVLAREAELEQLATQADQAARLTAKQTAQFDKLRADLSKLKEQRVSLIQRERIARSLASVGTSTTDMAEPIGLVVERMEEKIAFHEAAAEGALEMDIGSEDAGLDKYMQDRSVDDALAALRNEMSEKGDDK